MRNLAHVEIVHNIRPIEGADRIEQIQVLGWNLIARKGEFSEGDLCVYIEIDSKVPPGNPDFAFLENKGYKVKTMKMRGVVSQGLALPLSILPDGKYAAGTDVTELLGITKIADETEQSVKPTKKPFWSRLLRPLMRFQLIRKLLLGKKPDKNYPACVVKTDEPRVQNMPHILENKCPLIVTEKLDGTSAGYTLRGREFIVLSRNCNVTGDKNSCYAKIAEQLNMKAVLKALSKCHKFVTIQGEILGPGVQKNKYALENLAFYAFNLVIDGRKINSVEARAMLAPLGVQWVPVIATDYVLPDTVEELMAFSTGQSQLADTLREGLVFRDADNSISFKCVSNAFLLKHGL